MTVQPRRVKGMLRAQRGRTLAEVRGRIREARAGVSRGVLDEAEDSDANTQTGIEFALLQMNADTLGRIDAALERLDTREYGRCVSCGAPIAAKRLRVLPFAARCVACEERFEQETARARQAGAPEGSARTRFTDAGQE